MNKQVTIRLGWIKHYEEIKDAGITCRRCGISRPTLRKWLRRYEKAGLAGLEDLSRKPHTSPSTKVFVEQETIILTLRQERNLGVRRIQSELKRHHELSLSLATVHKVLKKYNLPYLQKKRAYRKQCKRYNCKIPGQRVQMDVCKVANGLYQYTAIDDCTRYKVIALYKRRTSQNTLHFLEEQVFYRLPFSIQRIQTDRGQEFMAYEVQEKLIEWGIKFRPVRPASPHLNGKVERSQRTDLDEFYSAVDIKSPNLEALLAEWEFYYNWHRPHSSLNGKTPNEKHCELLAKTPLWEEASNMFDHSKERIISRSYQADSFIKILKGSL